MTTPAPRADVSLLRIFRVFAVIGATAFGGGASAHIRRAVVDREKWMDDERFLEGLTLARALPGTNVSNLAAFVGSVLAGYRGAVVATFGVVAPGGAVILALAVLYTHIGVPRASLADALHGLGAGAVGVMAALVLEAARPVSRSAPRLVFAALAFVLVAALKWSVLLVLVVLTPLASWLAPDRPVKKPEEKDPS